MKGRTAITAALAALVLLVGAGPAAAASINVTPSAIPAGGTVTVSGSAKPGCDTGGEQVTLHSKAFSHENDFAGLPAIFATTKPGGNYSIGTQIPSNRAAGSYTIGGRCGGGNLGVQATLQVTAGSSGTLPRTGSDAWLLAGLGLCLLAGGLGLRRRAVGG